MDKYESTMGRKVTRVTLHTGVQIGVQIINTVDEVRHNVSMTLCEHGVLIKEANGKETVAGMADILTVKLA